MQQQHSKKENVLEPLHYIDNIPAVNHLIATDPTGLFLLLLPLLQTRFTIEEEEIDDFWASFSFLVQGKTKR